ncbi:UPF0223 protein YktA [Lysinibacillus alkalisoli]|uniref:UPF0223 protein YktA n=1 Tax=Lysinibacillus alkalisoli TaxID=1911548 RepID=A0A917LGB8_9BACI|nr:UPF0223 family protein [Lysinibacillus alkalisoli]GGG20713.1 UPF0223 protein YktA [Lysinibacillus alkalisoli]
MDYSYPLLPEWTTEEMIDVVAFFEAVEQAYEKGIQQALFMAKYKRFKEIVPSQAEEKTLCKQYEKGSGYIPYHVVKLAKASEPNRKLQLK